MEIDRASFGRAADRALLTRESPVKLRLGESPRMYKLKVYQTEEGVEIAGTREALKANSAKTNSESCDLIGLTIKQKRRSW